MKIIADVVGVRGTWDRDPTHWSDPESGFGDLMWEFYCGMLARPDFWNHALDGLLSVSLFDTVTHRRKDADWQKGGEHFAKWLLQYACGDDERPLLCIGHSHGNNVMAEGFSRVRTEERWMNSTRRVHWLAVDLPYRHGWDFIYNAALVALRCRNPAHAVPCVQTYSNGWNPKSIWRWWGAQRFPWDHPQMAADTLVPAQMVPQKGGHSAVLHRPGEAGKAQDKWDRKFIPWWKDVLGRFELENRDRRVGPDVMKVMPKAEGGAS